MPITSMPLSKVPTEAEVHLLETLEHGGSPIGLLDRAVVTSCLRKRWVWTLASCGLTVVLIEEKKGRAALAKAREAVTTNDQ